MVGPRYSSHSRFRQSFWLEQLQSMILRVWLGTYRLSFSVRKSGCSSDPRYFGNMTPSLATFLGYCGVPQYSNIFKHRKSKNLRLSLEALQNRLALTDLQGLVEVWRSELHESRASRAVAGYGTLKKSNLKLTRTWQNMAKIHGFRLVNT